MKIARFLFVLAVSVICMLSTGYSQTRTRTRQPYPTTANSVSWITDVPYVTGGGPQQQLDLYIPTNEWGEPLVIFVHGGGWAHGDKAGDSINPNNLDLLWDGYAMASINYRLAPGVLWPAQIEDCKAAIRWLKAHANDYGYDPNRVGVIGESAGGHLVAMLGATTGQAKFDVGENLNVTSDVNCVIDLFGFSDFSSLPNVAAVLLGPDKKSDPDLVKSISPVTYVHKDEPPMLILHGDVDKLALYEQATILAGVLDKVKARYHFHTVVGGGHNPYFGLNTNPETGNFDAGGGGVGIFADRDVQPMIRAYLRQYLLNRSQNAFRWVPKEGSPANHT